MLTDGGSERIFGRQAVGPNLTNIASKSFPGILKQKWEIRVEYYDPLDRCMPRELADAISYLKFGVTPQKMAATDIHPDR
jgi:hypothetical protein